MYCLLAHGNQDAHPEGVLRAEAGVQQQQEEDFAEEEHDPSEAGDGETLGAGDTRSADR